MSKCAFSDGIEIRPDGVHVLDPCSYKLKEIHHNVTVEICQCTKCGAIDISWTRQANTEDEIIDEIRDD